MKLNRVLCLVLVSVFSLQAEANSTWLANTLKLQREIDLNAPLNQATFLGTHNTENSKSYEIPFVRYVDPNQQLSIYDQLETGARMIEFDVQWALGEHGKNEVLLCHATDDHVGCSAFDRPVSEGLNELKKWLSAHPDEVVILYFDRHLDQHEPELAKSVEDSLGSFIYHTGITDKNTCAVLPAALTKAKILQAGKQLLLITKKCDIADLTWNNDVFAGVEHAQSSYQFDDSKINDLFNPYPTCGAKMVYGEDINHLTVWRIFEDRTILSSLVEKQRKLLADDVKELLRCGFNWISMDDLTKDDDRLSAAVWSWAENYPMANQGTCAIYKANTGIENMACNQTLVGYSCKQTNTQQWQIVQAAGSFSDGEKMCQSLVGSDWHFATPINSYQMYQLTLAVDAANFSEVWLNYAENKNGEWQAGAA